MCVAPVLASSEAFSDYMALRILYLPSPGYELSFHLTYQGWSAGSGEQLRHTDTTLIYVLMWYKH